MPSSLVVASSETTSPFANVNVVVPVVCTGKLVPKPLIWSRNPPALATQTCELPAEGGLSTADAAGAVAAATAIVSAASTTKVRRRSRQRVARMRMRISPVGGDVWGGRARPCTTNVRPRCNSRQRLGAETPEPGGAPTNRGGGG